MVLKHLVDGPVRRTVSVVSPDRSTGPGAFRRGWLATVGSVSHDIAGGWATTSCGVLEVSVHPALGWTKITENAVTFLILGAPLDTDLMLSDPAAIAIQIAEHHLRGGMRSALRYIAYLGGRFLCFISDGVRVTIIPDAGATISTYWTTVGGRLVLGSHTHLVAEVSGAEQNWPLIDLLRIAIAESPYVVYPPGAETVFVGVAPLIANHVLEVEGAEVRHSRFYPFGDTELPTDVDDAFDRFAQHFRAHVELLSNKELVSISLTAGRDSQATLHAFLPHSRPESFAWTVFDFEGGSTAALEDLLVANSSAVRGGMRHRIVSALQSTDDGFNHAIDRTFAAGTQNRRFAGAVFDQIDHATTNLQSMLAEIGTGFYKRRAPARPTAERLAATYTIRAHGRLPGAIEAFDRFIDYADFTPEHFGVFDYHDLLYWESRVTLWASLRLQELELSHTVAAPYNSRRVLEALVGPPFEDRAQKQALARFVATT